MVNDMMVTNGWVLEGIPGVSLPHFETLEGVSINSNTVETVDGITNKKKRFSTQIMDFAEMTLTRPFQSNVDDYALQIFAIACIKQGYKIDVTAVKRHKNVDVFTLLFRDFRFVSVQLPTLDVQGEEKFSVTYPATCDEWFMIPNRFEVNNPATLGTPAINKPIG